MTKARSHRTTGGPVWELADFFRKEALAGWSPGSLEFRREMGIKRAAGARWDVSFDVRVGGIGGKQFEIAVRVAQQDEDGTRGLTAQSRMRLFVFVETVEKRMWLLRYGGSFKVDDHDTQYGGYFNKYVKDVDELRREIAKLEALDLAALDKFKGAPKTTRR